MYDIDHHREERRDLALLLAALAISALYRALHVAPAQLGLAALGWSVEACAWLWLWLACTAAARRAPRALARLVHAGFTACLCFTLALSTAYTFFFDTALERRFSLLDVRGDGVGYFFANVLPTEGVITFIVVAAVTTLLALLLARVARPPSLRAAAFSALGVTLVASVAAARAERVATPLADLAHDLVELATLPAVTPSAVPRYAPRTLTRQRPTPDRASLADFDKVIVFVLESQTAQNLERERHKLPASTFVNAAAPHLHRHTRYFPGNQDSRTGMLGMLVPETNPREAYTDVDVARYRHLAQRPSLVRHMRALGYETAFAIPQVELELIVKDLGWQHMVHLDDASRAAKSAQFVCLNPYEFEHSCEDRAILPEVLAFLDAHPRAFLYYEFVWGHSFAYNQALGQSNTQYTSGFIDAVLAHLRARGELDRTLVAMVSDHGLRERELATDPEAYRIPLWFWAERFTPAVDDRLLSHLDFVDLLFTAMGDQTPVPPPNPFVLITGPTNSSLWSAVTADDDFMLLKARGERPLLLYQANVRDRARPAPPRRPTASSELTRLRADYGRGFGVGG